MTPKLQIITSRAIATSYFLHMIFAIRSLEVYENENKVVWLVHFDDKHKKWEKKVQVEKKWHLDQSASLSLEHTIKFVTASDDHEFSDIESSAYDSDGSKESDDSNSDYLDVSDENLGWNVKSSFEVDATQVCLHFCVLYFCGNCLSTIFIFFMCFPNT